MADSDIAWTPFEINEDIFNLRREISIFFWKRVGVEFRLPISNEFNCMFSIKMY